MTILPVAGFKAAVTKIHSCGAGIAFLARERFGM
jgi:hypothetical protein